MPLNEYEPGTAFPGVIGRTTDESSPAWPRPLRADAGSPNVVVVVLDDVGYGQLGCYGSLGRLSGARARAAEGTRRDAGRRGAVPARPGRPGVGLAVAGRSAGWRRG